MTGSYLERYKISKIYEPYIDYNIRDLKIIMLYIKNKVLRNRKFYFLKLSKEQKNISIKIDFSAFLF